MEYVNAMADLWLRRDDVECVSAIPGRCAAAQGNVGNSGAAPLADVTTVDDVPAGVL
jgi:hypothetical protein